ncbi:hypothetical protein DCO47_19165 [Pseudomonas sp. NDM]|uniref:Uncharacterized protein n=1 Tax=Pseudomonas fluorescens TaxID=294 RepID=A0AAE2AUV8_PSEFL|nr:hypothetical protein RU10_17425 [Pseudomonas fluorescens]PWB30828.1 hypothetical protein DCO47_19165 [Pseudomonas sp. NDM]
MRQNHLFFMFMQNFYLQMVASATKHREIFFLPAPMIVVGQDFLYPGMTASSLQEIHKIERRSHDPSV